MGQTAHDVVWTSGRPVGVRGRAGKDQGVAREWPGRAASCAAGTPGGLFAPLLVVGALHQREAVAALALEFTILTAARTGEVIGAKWDEVDLDKAIWTIPASRMKEFVELVNINWAAYQAKGYLASEVSDAE